MEKNQIPGLTIGFAKDETVWIKGFGYADVENKIPADANSAYRLASVQKSMTSAAIMQLVEQKKVDLDAPVQTYVPYFPQKQYPVTVRQLLGHLGGIRAYQAGETTIKTHKTTRQSLAIFADSPLLFEPGTKYAYTSYGYNLLGAVIEEASKQPYADYVQQHLWLPLTMNEIHMEDQTPFPNRVRGYRLVNGKVVPSEIIDISSRFAAGGTRAPVGDLLKWMKGLNDGKVLSASSLDTYYTPMNTQNGGVTKTTNYAMGWGVSAQKSGTVYTHSGGQQETTTYLLNFSRQAFLCRPCYEPRKRRGRFCPRPPLI